MSKYICLFILCVSFQIQSQSFFKKNTSIVPILKSDQRVNKSLNEIFFNLDISALKNYVSEIGGKDTQEQTILILPDIEGNFKQYKIFESSVMESVFQSDYPNIKSYKGEGITNPQETIRFTVTPLGFQAIILDTSEGTLHIKPYDLSKDLYSVHLNNDIIFDDNSFECQVLEMSSSLEKESFKNISLNANDGLLRDYRFAISATAEYSAFYNSNLSEVISAMNIAVSNANAVLERDLSVRLTMIDNTDLIFFDAETDPFTDSDNIELIFENQTLIDEVIGDENYDIGHVFNTAGGGVAGLGSSCTTNFKAYGVTSATSATDNRFLFVLLHELGHQFGSPHTFNASEEPCFTNISPSTALEPGSGSTIMAYPGLCGSQNVISSTAGDLYYHQISLVTMWNRILISDSCPQNQVATGNSAPVAEAGPDYLIPQGTPYKLTGSSTDPDGTSTHTYTWEQYDFGPAGAPDETTELGPLVRSFTGSSSPTRFIPRIQDLLINPGPQEWERLVNVDRDVNFRLTVRDNDILGGQTAVDAMTATVTTAAGPFKVTSQSTENSIVWTPGNTETITWNVAGTTGNGIGELNVNILLSTDEGLTYDTVLAANTPNDGSENIIVPDIDATKCRIMVEAVNNIFFNINDAFLAIGNYTYDEVCEDYVINFNSAIPENSSSYNPFPFIIDNNLEIDDLNFNVTLSGSEDNASITYGYSPPFGGFYELGIYPCPGTTGINLTFDDEGSTIDCLNLNSGENVLPVQPLSVVDGEIAQGNWTFWITDVNEDGVLSNIESITLNICSVGAVPNLSVEDNTFKSFSLYPNPSHGTFNLSLNTTLSNDINVEVFDIIGRSVKRFIYAGQSSFTQSIDVNELSSGVYIINVNQGKINLSKKLIIN